MEADTRGKETKWCTGEIQHEGFPLHLRFPQKPDFNRLQTKFPKILVVKHSLSKVRSSGLPEPDYNESLADFDHELITAFDAPFSGITVLIETFGGRRTYYIYVSADAPIESMRQSFATQYPQHKLDWKLRDDPGWKFIRGYSEEYNFYRKA